MRLVLEVECRPVLLRGKAEGEKARLHANGRRRVWTDASLADCRSEHPTDRKKEIFERLQGTAVVVTVVARGREGVGGGGG